MKTNLFRKNYSSPKWGVRTMRLALLLLPLLGRGLGGGCVLFAQNGVTVSNLAVDAGTVTFNVSWKNSGMPSLWSDTVWVFVDYNNAGKMERLPLLSGSTLTTTSPGGKVIEEPDNNKGVWVAGNARDAGAFSATVQLLTAVKDVGGACVYGSNYPPVGEYSKNDASEIKFTGTPQYDVALLHESGNLVTTTTSSPLHVPAGYTMHSFTDKTAAPGKLSCIPSTVYTLTASASTFCEGGAGITFALSGTEPGRIYQLYKNGTTVVASLAGDGNAATFCEAVNEAGTYTAHAVAFPAYCPAVMTGSYPVASTPSPEAPVMSGGGSFCNVTTTAITAAAGNGGTGIRWTDNNETASPRTVTETDMYYAVTTSANGCESDMAMVTVAVLGAYGMGAYPCGCASPYAECNGICKCSGCTDCVVIDNCPSITQVSPPPPARYVHPWAEAKTFCSSLGYGWHLPTQDEMSCVVALPSVLGAPHDCYWIDGCCVWGDRPYINCISYGGHEPAELPLSHFCVR
jgi:hypothetical protein